MQNIQIFIEEYSFVELKHRDDFFSEVGDCDDLFMKSEKCNDFLEVKHYGMLFLN